jgi:hypothetical protein
MRDGTALTRYAKCVSHLQYEIGRIRAILPAMDIEQENQIRTQAGLPLLDVATEGARLNAAREEAEFNRLWELRRPALCHQWTGNNDGWMTNMGRWSHARRRVRDELRSTHLSR